MLRVGLTGGLGSGKSTVAAIFREQGVAVLEVDEVARQLMEPGESVYRAIVEHFGPAVLLTDGRLDRAQLARLAFVEGRLKELNARVHPPVIAAEERWTQQLFEADPDSVAMVESALIFETSQQEGSVANWRDRFDRILLVTAPDAVKIARYVARVLATKQPEANPTQSPVQNPGQSPAQSTAQSPEQMQKRIQSIEQDARARLAAQIPDEQKIPLCSAVIDNSGDLAKTRAQVQQLAEELRKAARERR